MEFQYKAMKADGQVFEGVFVGNSVEEVAQMLRNNQSYPISIQEYVKLGSKEITFAKKIGPKELSFFCRQLYAMLNAGSTIIRCLDIMQKQIENKTLRSAVSQMYADVQKGKLLSQAMKAHPRIFPDLMTYMVESGELGGNLDDLLLRLANYFEKDSKIKNKVKSAMVYPIILLVVSNVVVLFLVTFIMPTFAGMFEDSGTELPGPTKFLLALADVLQNNVLLILAGLLVLILLFRQFINSRQGRRVFDKLKLRIPLVGRLNLKVITGRFARNLGTMLSSGVPLLTALDNVSRIIGNKVIEEVIQKYREDIQKGNELHQVVRDSKVFPPMLDNMMEVGKESGSLDDILEKTADYYDDEAEQDLQKLVSMFEPVMIIFLAVIIGFIVISMAMPMFDMANTVQ